MIFSYEKSKYNWMPCEFLAIFSNIFLTFCLTRNSIHSIFRLYFIHFHSVIHSFNLPLCAFSLRMCKEMNSTCVEIFSLLMRRDGIRVLHTISSSPRCIHITLSPICIRFIDGTAHISRNLSRRCGFSMLSFFQHLIFNSKLSFSLWKCF